MLDLGFDPSVTLGPLRLTWHGLFGLLAAVAGALAGIRLVRPRVSFDDGYAIATWGILGGLLGSRLFHVLDRLPFYLERPAQALAVWDGGESIIGGIVGGILAAVVVIRRRRLPLGFILDRGGTALPLGMAIGRIGDVINGEHYATACTGLAWCVRYTHPDSVGQRDWVHPAVAYELLLDLAICGLLLALHPWAGRRPRQGGLLALFLVLYGAGRLALSAFRLDPLWIAGLTQAQIVSAVFVLGGSTALWLLRQPVRTSAAA